MIPNNVAIIDTETTGLEQLDEVIEFAAVMGNTLVTVGIDQLYGTTRKILPEVSAVHHIREEDLAGKPLFSDSAPLLRDEIHRAGVSVLVAHNAEFDRKMMGSEFMDFDWICTYKVALHLFPDATSHKNESLCYMLGVGKLGREARNTGQAHSALFDAQQTAALFEYMLQHVDIDQMIRWTKDVKNITKLGFGKHKGKTWAEIDSGYLGWMTKNLEDADLIELATRELRRRK